jgi:hypothetical protein
MNKYLLVGIRVFWYKMISIKGIIKLSIFSRLLSRFLSRICEVFELQVQRRRVQFSGSK